MVGIIIYLKYNQINQSNNNNIIFKIGSDELTGKNSPHRKTLQKHLHGPMLFLLHINS